MTTIKATCPTCGEVTITPADIELRAHRADAGSSYYVFTCPDCLGAVRKPANERVVRLLVSGGVQVVDREAPPVRLAERFDGPRISHDDLLDFHAVLDTIDWFAVLVDLVDRDSVRGGRGSAAA